MGLFKSKDEKNIEWIKKNCGIYVNEMIRNYNVSRRNGNNENQAMEFIKNDMRKRG
jgi:hypothetical protein